MVSSYKIDNYLFSVESYLRNSYGIDEAARNMSPLYWYINSGRACLEFLRLLLVAKPFMVARRLHKGGSDEEILRRVKKLIGFKEDT